MSENFKMRRVEIGIKIFKGQVRPSVCIGGILITCPIINITAATKNKIMKKKFRMQQIKHKKIVFHDESTDMKIQH
jgi:hypothetical protein